MNVIHYTKGNYKYQLEDQYVSVPTDIRLEEDILTSHVCLMKSGLLSVSHGYAWDGPSGPTIDTKSFMRGSLFHDALYQLMRQELLDRKWKDTADRLLQKVCIADGMWKVRAWWVYQGVKRGGFSGSHPNNRRRIFTAP